MTETSSGPGSTAVDGRKSSRDLKNVACVEYPSLVKRASLREFNYPPAYRMKSSHHKKGAPRVSVRDPFLEQKYNLSKYLVLHLLSIKMKNRTMQSVAKGKLPRNVLEDFRIYMRLHPPSIFPRKFLPVIVVSCLVVV